MLIRIPLADEHKQLVELACATALAPAYDSRILEAALSKKPKVVVIIVCGGVNINMAEMVEYGTLLDGRDPYSDNFWLDGKVVQ